MIPGSKRTFIQDLMERVSKMLSAGVDHEDILSQIYDTLKLKYEGSIGNMDDHMREKEESSVPSEAEPLKKEYLNIIASQQPSEPTFIIKRSH